MAHGRASLHWRMLWEQWGLGWLRSLPAAELGACWFPFWAGGWAGVQGVLFSPKAQPVCSRGNGFRLRSPRRTAIVAPALGKKGGEGMAEKILPEADPPRDAFTPRRAERGFAPTPRWRVQGRGESGSLCLIKLGKRED